MPKMYSYDSAHRQSNYNLSAYHQNNSILFERLRELEKINEEWAYAESKEIIDFILHLSTQTPETNKPDDYFKKLIEADPAEFNDPLKSWLENNQEAFKTEHWRLLIDGNRHHKGPYAFDNREPGYLRAMRNAASYMLLTIDEELTVDLLKKYNELAKNGVQFTTSDPDRAQKGKVSFSDQQFGLTASTSTPAGLAQLQRSIDENEFGYKGQRPTLTEPHEKSYILYSIPAADDELIQKIIDEYNASKADAATLDEKLLTLIKMVQSLDQIHAFEDGNIRTFVMLLLNRELIKLGQQPVWFENPNIFDAFSREELLDKLKEAQLNNNLQQITQPSEVSYFPSSYEPLPQNAHDYIWKNSITALEEGLSDGTVDINDKGNDNQSLVTTAIRAKNIPALETVLKHKPEINERDIERSFPTEECELIFGIKEELGLLKEYLTRDEDINLFHEKLITVLADYIKTSKSESYALEQVNTLFRENPNLFPKNFTHDDSFDFSKASEKYQGMINIPVKEEIVLTKAQEKAVEFFKNLLNTNNISPALSLSLHILIEDIKHSDDINATIEQSELYQSNYFKTNTRLFNTINGFIQKNTPEITNKITNQWLTHLTNNKESIFQKASGSGAWKYQKKRNEADWSTLITSVKSCSDNDEIIKCIQESSFYKTCNKDTQELLKNVSYSKAEKIDHKKALMEWKATVIPVNPEEPVITTESSPVFK